MKWGRSGFSPVRGDGAGRWVCALEDIIIGPCAPGFPENPSSPCPPAIHLWPAHSRLTNPSWTNAGQHGRFVSMDAARASDVQLDLAVRRDDVSVAKLPIVDATAFSRSLRLLNVPVRATHTALRIYGLDNAATSVRIRIADVETIVALTPSPYVDPTGLPYAPSHAEIAIEGVTSADNVDIELEASDPIWAFAASSADDRLVVTAP